MGFRSCAFISQIPVPFFHPSALCPRPRGLRLKQTRQTSVVLSLDPSLLIRLGLQSLWFQAVTLLIPHSLRTARRYFSKFVLHSWRRKLRKLEGRVLPLQLRTCRVKRVRQQTMILCNRTVLFRLPTSRCHAIEQQSSGCR